MSRISFKDLFGVGAGSKPIENKKVQATEVSSPALRLKMSSSLELSPPSPNCSPEYSMNTTDGRNITRLWDKHHQMKRLMLLGYGNKEIAEMLDVSPQTVCNIRNSELMQKELARLNSVLDEEVLDVARELQKLGGKSVKILERVLDAEDAPLGLRMRAATEVLSRTGFAPVARIQGTVNHTHFSSNEIEAIKAAALAAASGCLADSEVIDAEVKTIN